MDGGEMDKSGKEAEEAKESKTPTSQDDQEVVRLVDDDDFIDDNGVDPAGLNRSNNEPRSPIDAPQAEEGEEDDEIKELFKMGKKKKCEKSAAQMDTKNQQQQKQQEALRLKTLAEEKFISSNLKSALKYAKRAHLLFPNLDGLSELLTAFKILRIAAKPTTALDWYKILQIEPFSHINTIKKQYKKLALTLHPDKNPFIASEEAFKLVGESFRVLSDKIRRKEYDMKLRIAMQAAAVEAAGGGAGEMAVETFWTACSTCRLLHQFEKRYLGHNLMCPSCKKSFKAVEVLDSVKNGEEGESIGTRASARIRARVSVGERSESSETKRKMRKMSSVGEVLARSKSRRIEERLKNVGGNRVLSSAGNGGVVEELGLKRTVRSKNDDGNKVLNSGGGGVVEGLRSKRVVKLRNMDNKKEMSSGVDVLESSKVKRAKRGEEEMMTLAEMQMLAKQKVNEEKLKLKEIEKQKEKEKVKEKEKSDEHGASEDEPLEIAKQRALKRASRRGELEIMAVEDADFYDFDKDRVERSFKKGQVWAIYDDDDGMPRHYGLIDEVVSVNPFEVKMSWLDLQNNGDEGLICWEKMGFHISCGRFKVSRKNTVKSLNVFSHVVDCDRVAREVYRIHPKKGSVWALYNENALDAEGRNLLVKNNRCYDIVVFLTSYSEIHGLSMAYLDKVDGFKTVFKRREIGCHAIRWLEKDDVRLFSHQVPARKLSGEELSNLTKYCWELDPASLPPELLTIGNT